jgi:hypothetical protein
MLSCLERLSGFRYRIENFSSDLFGVLDDLRRASRSTVLKRCDDRGTDRHDR